MFRGCAREQGTAKCSGWTKYFEGEITRVNRDGTYAVRFDDGERKSAVTEDQIKGSLSGDTVSYDTAGPGSDGKWSVIGIPSTSDLAVGGSRSGKNDPGVRRCDRVPPWSETL